MAFKPLQYAVLFLAVHFVAGCSGGEKTPAAGANEASPAAMVPAAPAAAPAARDEKLVLAFGDSLYAGRGVDADESFPVRLEAALRAQGVPAKVHNAGVSGDTSAAGLEHLAYTLDGLPRAPDLVIVGLGGNDMLRGLDPAVTRSSLDSILAELARRGIPAMLTGMVAAPNLGRDYAARFNPIYPELARKYDVPLYPFFLDQVVDRPELMQADRIHPKAEGIRIVVGKVSPMVERALAKDGDGRR